MAIYFEHVYKSYGDKKVLDNYSLEINEAEMTTIMGQSGCGKTTILHLIAGLIQPDKGRIRGLENKKLSMVFQEDRLFPWFTVLDNVLVVENGVSKEKKSLEKAMYLLDKLDISDCMDKKTEELSGGMQRRVSIARALLVDFDILLLDEPFKGLDLDTKEQAVACMKEFIADKSVIMVTHDKRELSYFQYAKNISL